MSLCALNTFFQTFLLAKIAAWSKHAIHGIARPILTAVSCLKPKI